MDDIKMKITEKELCEICNKNSRIVTYESGLSWGTKSCIFEGLCNNAIACKNFRKEKEYIPTYCVDIEGNYNGKDKDRLWENVNKKENIAVEGENKMEITEKELCEYCGIKEKCVSCKYSKNCDNFCEVLGTRPYYFLSPERKYTGRHPDRLWEEKEFEEELSKTEKKEKKDKYVEMNDIKNENKNESKEENNAIKSFFINTDNICAKYPIDRNKEYVCIFDGNVINNNFVNVNVYGIITDINENNIVIYNKEHKNICMIDRKSIKCLLPKENYDLIRGTN